MSKKLVSVVIPAYNCADTICEALESVFNQTYSNLEIIVINDGSTDETKHILQEFSSKIIYLEHENGGPGSARNKGIRVSRGDYIAFLDADDILAPNKIELQLGCFSAFPEVGLVFSDFSTFNQHGVIKDLYMSDYFEVFRRCRIKKEDIFSQGIDNKNNFFSLDASRIMFLGNIVLPSTALISRGCINKVGLFNEKYKYNSEYELFLKMSKEFKFGFVGSALTKYRSWKGNFSKRQNNMDSACEITSIIKIFIDGNKDFYENNSAICKTRLSDLRFQIALANILDGSSSI